MKSEDSMAASGLGCRKALLATGWANSLLHTNGPRKQPSGLVECTFLTTKLLSQSAQAVIGCKLTIENSLMWFESRSGQGWLQRQLGDVLILKTQRN